MSNKGKSASKYASLGFTRDSSGLFPVASIDANLLKSAVEAVVQSGDGITFSRTRNGDTLAVTLLSDGHAERRYFTEIDELHELLKELVKL